MATTIERAPCAGRKVTRAARIAMSYIANGWDIVTAVACAHDTVYDVIGMNEFINVVQAELRSAASVR